MRHVPHYFLIGGHSAGRVVAFDDPAPPYIQVPYRHDAISHDAISLDEFPADYSEVSFGRDTYDLVILSHADRGQAPYGRAYVCRDDLAE